MHFPDRTGGAFLMCESVQVDQDLTRCGYFGTMTDNVVNNFVIFLMVLK